MFVVKFAIMDLLFICAFNPVLLGVDTERTVWIVPLELMAVKCLVYVLCSALLIVIWPAPVLSTGAMTEIIATVVEDMSIKLDRLMLLVCLDPNSKASDRSDSPNSVNGSNEVNLNDVIISEESVTAMSSFDEFQADIEGITGVIDKSFESLRDMAQDLKLETYVLCLFD